LKFIGQLVGRHLAKYPRMQLLDVYKLLHQAALGNSHIMGTAEQIQRLLREETAALGDGPAEPIWEAISPDSRLARVHLRSYLAAGYDLADLAGACLGTPTVCAPAPEKLTRFCACLGDLATEGILPFDKQEVVTCMDEIAEEGYPAVHHTRVFRDTYKPAYRVVAIELLPTLQRSSS